MTRPTDPALRDPAQETEYVRKLLLGLMSTLESKGLLTETEIGVIVRAAGQAVYAAPGGYTVQLTISSATARANVSLLDPLPTGATLKEGRNTYSGSLPAGELRLTYTFEWNGTPEGATTDPELSWR